MLTQKCAGKPLQAAQAKEARIAFVPPCKSIRINLVLRAWLEPAETGVVRQSCSSALNVALRTR
jgi:hypothetical protein